MTRIVFFAIVDDQTSRSCVYRNETYENKAIWKDDCNQCRCIRGIVRCNRVKCGPRNCYEDPSKANCVCREKTDVDCVTPPCRRWGECVTYETSSIQKGGCTPSLYKPSLNADCSTVNIKFEKVLLPTVC
jgi:von Willebrand factor type C domain.